MPEALAVFFILAVSAFLFVTARIRGRATALIPHPDDIQRLRQHESWLRERLDRAEREQWDDAMIASLAAELRAASRQLDRQSGTDATG